MAKETLSWINTETGEAGPPEQPKAIEEKRPVGRPKLPETILKELNQKIQELNIEIASKNDPYEEMKQLAEIIRVIQRAMKGLAAEDDVFLGLINAKDIKERTRLDETALLSHSAMRVAASKWPEFRLFETIAEMEDPYYISQDGEGRREGILLQQARSKLDANLILNMPNTQGGVAQTEQAQAAPPQKKGLFNRMLKR